MKNSPPPPCPECNRLRDGNLGTFCDIHEVAFTAHISPPPTPEIEWTARFNNGNGGASITIDGRSVFVTGEQARELAVALVGPARVDARASIVAFLASEAKRFDRAADEFDAMDKADSADRCRTKAGHTRTLAAQIERGDDRQGEVTKSRDSAGCSWSAEIVPGDARFGSAADREVER